MKCDAKAFAGMYESVYKDLYRFALCMMKGQHDAEDAVSDAVVNAYGNIASLKDASAFKSWIFAILANVCKKKIKESAKRQDIAVPDFFDLEDVSGAEEDYAFALDVRKAFAVLSGEEQMIVGLSVFGGYKSHEIATLMHLNASTVRSKRKRALEKMSFVLE